VYEVNPAVEGQWGTSGPYERLSRLLVEILRTGLGAEDVGRRAADLFRVPSPSGDVVADMSAAMARQWFEPDVRTVRGGAEVVLRTCPFATVALADRETICGLHLGIAEGLVEDSDAMMTELVAYDPRTANCRVRIRLGVDDRHDRTEATLSLRSRAAAW
jgi:hypothetical protein